MRCQPNDLALIVSTDGCDWMKPHIGKIVRVLKPMSNPHDELCWTYEGGRLPLAAGEVIDCIPDSMLKPLPKLDGVQDTTTGRHLEAA